MSTSWPNSEPHSLTLTSHKGLLPGCSPWFPKPMGHSSSRWTYPELCPPVTSLTQSNLLTTLYGHSFCIQGPSRSLSHLSSLTSCDCQGRTFLPSAHSPMWVWTHILCHPQNQESLCLDLSSEILPRLWGHSRPYLLQEAPPDPLSLQLTPHIWSPLTS